jgi:hypothetical protein
MSEAYNEALEAEAYEAAGEVGYEGEAAGEAGYEGEAAGEAGYEGEADYEAYGESARSDARRRRDARQRQIMLARQRQAQLRRQPPPPQRRMAGPAPTPRQTIAAIRGDIRDLNLDTKVDLDSLRRALNEANRRGDKAMYSALLSIVANQALSTFDPSLENHEVVSAAIRWAPSLLLTNSKGKPGIEGFLLSPPVLAGAVVAGVLISGHFINAPHSVSDILVSFPSPLGASGEFTGTAIDRNGKTVDATITWYSQNPSILNVNSDGNYNSVSAGDTTVSAVVPGHTTRTDVTVLASDVPAPSGGTGSGGSGGTGSGGSGGTGSGGLGRIGSSAPSDDSD